MIDPSLISPALPVKQCDAIRKMPTNAVAYRDSFNRVASPVRTAEHALQQLESARAADVATHEANLTALAHNRALHEHVVATMRAAGIPDTWSMVQQTRARYPKKTTQQAGYLGDLSRNVVTDDNFAAAMLRHEQLLQTYTKHKEEAEAAAAQVLANKRAAEEAVKAHRRANIQLATLLIRYGLGVDDDWPELLAALRKRDQRVDLAVAMRLTRGDWSDGFYRVAEALDRFTIQTDEDKDIATDVVSCMRDDDGRVFRDTRWSYDALFASVQDRQLADDVQLVLSNIGDLA